jgi:hypothetical protein
MLRRHRLYALLALTLAACSKDPPAPSAAATSAPAAPSPAASSAAAPPASSAALAAPPPTASAAAAPAAPASPEPSLKEWDATKLELGLLKNWDATGCVARRIREWVRIGCSTASSKNGPPVEIQLVKGFTASKLSILKERGGSTMLVFPVTPGLDGEALFTFAEGSYRFVARWTAGESEPKPIGSFEKVEMPSEEQNAGVGSSDSNEETAKPSAAAAPAEPLPEEPTIEGAPKLAEWEAAREVGVKGSSALGCETKQIGDWFRMVCRPNEKAGKVTAGVAVRGLDTTKGYLVTGNGSLVLLTQFVKGTDTAIDITWERTSSKLLLKWPETAAAAPSPRGEFVARP